MTASSSAAPVLPPFYTEPVALHSARHAEWRLLAGDARFAAAEPAVPITAGEFAAAARDYPILFGAGEVPSPVALMGLERSNLFLGADGRWAEGAYAPAFVRRYPFLLIEAADKSGYGLAIDAASPQLAKKGRKGRPLFDKGEAGLKPSALTLQALEFCRLFNEDHQRTLAFGAALAAQGLLVERRADVTLPDGRKLGVQGFRVIDAERLAALDAATVVDWHRRGWLALAQMHLASLDRFAGLVARLTDDLSPSPGKTAR